MINRIRVVTLLVMVLGVFALLFPAVCFFLPFTIARRALWFPINYGNSRAS